MDGLTIRNGTASSLDQLGTGIQKTTQSQQKTSGASSSVTDVSDSFAGTLKKAIHYVDSVQKEADIKMQKLATGQSTDIHGTMIAAEKAEVALKFMIQVRNKIIDAYHEIMKMQV